MTGLQRNQHNVHAAAIVLTRLMQRLAISSQCSHVPCSLWRTDLSNGYPL